MSWRSVRLAGGLREFATSWDDLCLRLTGGNPLLDSAFVDNLLAHFGTGDEWLCMLERQGLPAAMCIVQRHRVGVWRSFLPAQAQLGATLVADLSDLKGLPAALPGPLLLLDLLRNDPRHSLLHLPTKGQPVTWQRPAITMAIPLTGSFDDYWQARPKKLRENIRRYERRASSDGAELQFRMITETGAVQDAVRRYAELERQGWKSRQGTDLGAQPRQLDFYLRILHHHGVRQQAVAAELWHNGQLAASRLAIVQGGMVIALKTTFDESKRDWAPGRVMLRRFIQAAFEQWPGHQFEFYTNAAPEQLDWAGSQRSIHDVTIYRNRRLWALGKLWYALRRRQVEGGQDSLTTEDGLERVQAHREFSSLPASAKPLLDRAEEHNVEWGSGWLDAQARTVMRDSSGVRWLSLHHGPLAVAVMACNVDASLQPLGCRVGAMSSFYTSSWSPALAPHTTIFGLMPLLKRLRVVSGRAARLWFSPMDPQRPEFLLMREALRQVRYAVFEELAHGNWYLPVRGDYAQYLASRSRTTRSILKQAQKKSSSANIRFEIVANDSALDAALAAYATVYAHSWKRAEPVQDVIAELTAACASKGWLRIGVAWLGDTPIAAQIWIIANGRAAIFKMAYDENHKLLGTGNVLTALLMQHSIDVDKVQEVDYLVGDDPYKQQWMSHRREMMTLVACDLTTFKGCAWAVRHRLAEVAWLRRIWHHVRHRLARVSPAAHRADADDSATPQPTKPEAAQ